MLRGRVKLRADGYGLEPPGRTEATRDSGTAMSAEPEMPDPRRLRALRLSAGYGAVACAFPYLALKLVWLAGGTVGVADARLMHEPGMIALNAATAGMDVVAIALAIAFTARWGMRVPAWLLLPPMWAASGLLARFALAVPVVTVAGLLTTGAPPRVSGGPVQPWVYSVVYTGFAGMGVGLTLAFVLHARARWTAVFEPCERSPSGDATRAVQLPLAHAAALTAAAVGALHLLWAMGFAAGLPPELTARRSISSHLVNAIDGGLSLAAAAGIYGVVHTRGGTRPLWRPIVLAWLGAGSLFAWGLWQLVNVLAHTPLVRERPQGMALFNLLALGRVLAGLTIGVVLLLALAERTAGARARPSPSGSSGSS
jgi:hypothetical protein